MSPSPSPLDFTYFNFYFYYFTDLWYSRRAPGSNKNIKYCPKTKNHFSPLTVTAYYCLKYYRFYHLFFLHLKFGPNLKIIKQKISIPKIELKLMAYSEPSAKRTKIQERHINLAVVGCSHGELDAIYSRIEQEESRNHKKIDLLLCCGDFQV